MSLIQMLWSSKEGPWNIKSEYRFLGFLMQLKYLYFFKIITFIFLYS